MGFDGFRLDLGGSELWWSNQATIDCIGAPRYLMMLVLSETIVINSYLCSLSRSLSVYLRVSLVPLYIDSSYAVGR